MNHWTPTCYCEYTCYVLKILPHSKQTLPYFLICFSRGQTPLHILGQYGRDNAGAIFDLFKESMPNYPLDKPDADGNTGKTNITL